MRLRVASRALDGLRRLPPGRGRWRRARLDGAWRLGILLALALLVLIPGYIAYDAFTTPTTVSRELVPWSWEHEAAWDYTVLLKPNSLYETDTLGPGLTYFDALTEGIQARFSYTFTSDLPARIEGWYEVEADLAAGELWSESSLIVPRTPFYQEGTSYRLDLEVPIDRQAYMERVAEIEEETAVRAPNATLVLTGRVHAEASSEAGRTGSPESNDEDVLQPALVLPLSGASFTLSGELSARDQDTITRHRRIFRPWVEDRRRFSLLATGLTALLPLLFALVTAARPPTENAVTREVRALRRRYRKRIAVADPHESSPRGQKTVPLASMEDLARVSDELLKPMIYYADANPGRSHIFYVLDGPVRYEVRLPFPPDPSPEDETA